MHGSKDFRIWHAGQRWCGWWEIAGKDVLVCSAYGSKRRALRGRDPEKVAEKLLLQIVKERGR